MAVTVLQVLDYFQEIAQDKSLMVLFHSVEHRSLLDWDFKKPYELILKIEDSQEFKTEYRLGLDDDNAFQVLKRLQLIRNTHSGK